MLSIYKTCKTTSRVALPFKTVNAIWKRFEDLISKYRRLKNEKSKRTNRVLVFNEWRSLTGLCRSAKTLAELLHVTPQAISKCCSGRSIMCKGVYLRYLHPDMEVNIDDWFEYLDLIQYDKMCGEEHFYFKYSKSRKRDKLTANQIRSLESSIKNKALARLNEFYPHNLRVIANNGWFMEMDSNRYFPEILETNVDGESINALDIEIANYYETNLKEIIKELCERHPKRKNLISTQIMSSYKRGHYELAIIGILVQVDWICKDNLNKHFFLKRKNENKEYIPSIVNDLLDVQDDYFKVFITPILHDCPIFVHYSRLRTYPSDLNRHEIIHGTDIDFGNKVNFLKSLSLLKYVSDILYFSELCKNNRRRLEKYIYPKSDWV